MSVDYINYFLYFRAAKHLFNAYSDKNKFIDLFYQFRLDDFSYPVSCKLFDETKFIVDLANEMGREIFVKGFIEESLTYILHTNIRVGDGFIDCGAHMGYYSKLASKAVGEQGHVSAFEPNPDIFKICQANVSGEGNVSIHNLAITDTGNAFQLRMFGHEYSPYNTLLDKPRSIDIQPKRIIQVGSALLQDVIYELRSKITTGGVIWIKIDIEGLEAPVIQSSIDAIVDNKCCVIFEGSFQPEVNLSIFELFKSRSYLVYEISDFSLIPVDPRKVTSTTETTYFMARRCDE